MIIWSGTMVIYFLTNVLIITILLTSEIMLNFVFNNSNRILKIQVGYCRILLMWSHLLEFGVGQFKWKFFEWLNSLEHSREIRNCSGMKTQLSNYEGLECVVWLLLSWFTQMAEQFKTSHSLISQVNPIVIYYGRFKAKSHQSRCGTFPTKFSL